MFRLMADDSFDSFDLGVGVELWVPLDARATDRAPQLFGVTAPALEIGRNRHSYRNAVLDTKVSSVPFRVPVKSHPFDMTCSRVT